MQQVLLRHTFTPVNRKSEGISLFSLSLVLGTAIGPFLGMLLITKYAIDLLFFIFCVIFRHTRTHYLIIYKS
ncbi:hypothetical protein ACVNPX_13445 [Staphylococcus aureus]